MQTKKLKTVYQFDVNQLEQFFFVKQKKLVAKSLIVMNNTKNLYA